MSEKHVTVIITVSYPIDVVWRAFTEPEIMSQWLMETDFKPETGKAFQFRGKANKFWRGWVDCKVICIRPLEEIQFTWQSIAGQTPTNVTYLFHSVTDGTLIRAVHSGFDSSHGFATGWFMRLMLQHGMNEEFLKKLPKVLGKLK